VDVGLKLEDLQFRYHISGSAPWKPIRVFDDGKKVYIQFPSGLSQGEAPPLFVIASNGQPALVNYRVRNNYYIVDRLSPRSHGILALNGKCIPLSIKWSSRWCPVTHYNGDRTTSGWVKARFVRDNACP
ncbi:MAG: TrbG/VirB9 family P-type conjugative transfer protein, partial [Hyphomicrobiaceae bacterium]|nr:TrbG/VirB9 family P-type conjugative transfer protein [Hyphomicrobiaceae bacterium]